VSILSMILKYAGLLLATVSSVCVGTSDGYVADMPRQRVYFRAALSIRTAKTLQVLRHFLRQWEVPRIEALNLLNARSGVLGEIENIDLSLRLYDSHTYCGVSEGIDCMVLT
jgi:hypothetical protein